MPGFSWLKLLPYLGAILLLGTIVGFIYHLGSNHGEAVVQAKWDHQKDVDAKFVAVEKAKIKVAEDTHNQQDRKISDELSNLKVAAAADHARIAGELALRLQNSAKREAVYRAASEGSAAERERLASYAAKLDRSLSEGISLVDELRATLEVRDGQLKALGAQIINDRQLMNGSGEADGQFKPTR